MKPKTFAQTRDFKIGIQGDSGSNHDLAVRKLWHEGQYQLNCYKTFAQLSTDLADGVIDLAVMAIENSIAGDILANYDLISTKDLKIKGEVYLRIEHCLIGLENSDISKIKAVYSHEMALKQCMDFLADNQIEPREYYDTAASVEYIKELNDPSIAGIAPAIAAQQSGVKVLRKGIETDKNNFTRFLVLSRSTSKSSVLTGRDSATVKASLELILPHRPGSLVEALNELARSNLNLTKIVSRPILGKPWEYRFFIDLIADSNEPEAVSRQLQSLPFNLKILGIYFSGETFHP